MAERQLDQREHIGWITLDYGLPVAEAYRQLRQQEPNGDTHNLVERALEIVDADEIARAPDFLRTRTNS